MKTYFIRLLLALFNRPYLKGANFPGVYFWDELTPEARDTFKGIEERLKNKPKILPNGLIESELVEVKPMEMPVDTVKLFKPGYIHKTPKITKEEIQEAIMKDAPPKKKCPNCASEDIRDISERADNGIIGPGYCSWIVREEYKCNFCNQTFQPI